MSEESNNDHEDSLVNVAIIATIAVGVFLVGLVIIAKETRRRLRQKREQRAAENSIPLQTQTENSSIKIIKTLQRIDILEKIGSGAQSEGNISW